jgi:hypothetical protein
MHRDPMKLDPLKVFIFILIWLVNCFFISPVFIFSPLIPLIPIIAAIIGYQAAKIIGGNNLKLTALSTMVWLPFPGYLIISNIGAELRGDEGMQYLYSLALLGGAAVGFSVKAFHLLIIKWTK